MSFDNSRWTRREVLASGLALGTAGSVNAQSGPGGSALGLENEHFALQVDAASGAISSLFVKRNGAELIRERRLMANFRICLPLPDYACNYIDGMEQRPSAVEKGANSINVRFERMQSPKGSFPLGLSYSISLDGDCIRFRANLKNPTDYPISEFWFPRLGGWTDFGGRDAALTAPIYVSCRQNQIFRRFPGRRDLGAEAAEWSMDYPDLTMPWLDLYDQKTNTGLYLGYHDPICRFSTWHLYLLPEMSGEPGDNWISPAQAAGEPVGLVFSHVRYPFTKAGEFQSGEFILRVHEGDWHQGSLWYREWFLRNFPFDKSKNWLRKHSAWFSSIIYQPEDKIVADYKTYDQWCRDAEKYGIRCHELSGWDKGGLERDYPEYIPEKKLGGREGYRDLQQSIRKRGARCLTFVNYNFLDSSTDLYRRELHAYSRKDEFGNTKPHYWGESTLVARKGLNVHQHVLSSVIPPMQRLLEGHFLELVKDGAPGFQIDKTVASRGLDFNPLCTSKPDVALCQDLVTAIGELYERCRRIDPEFCLASEHSQDRLIPYVDVAYRACGGYNMSPLRYVFPEWTSVQHIGTPRDFRGVNGAVLTGAVICVEPHAYQGTLADPLYRELAEYIREVERIRAELAEVIFLGRYLDDQGAEVRPIGTAPREKALYYAVHAHSSDGRQAIVIANDSPRPCSYTWRFTKSKTGRATLYAPFQAPRPATAEEPIEIPAVGLHILVSL